MHQTVGSLLAAAAFCVAPATAMEAPLTAPLAQTTMGFELDSGNVANTTGADTEVVFDTIVAGEGNAWVRMTFDELTLGSTPEGVSSVLRITSLHDGAQQLLDATSAHQWRYTSAYFNGDTVRIEIVAPAGAAPSRLQMSEFIASDANLADAESLCGADDRQLSFDNRAARALPIGCTAWIMDDCANCFGTAGHCNGGASDITVVQFNVPLSTSGGALVNPPPEDQYAVDPASRQTNGGGGVGNDWGYFGVFPNSNTNLTPIEAYGASYTTTLDKPALDDPTTVTGYGSTSSPVSPTWYLVQKTHSGPFRATTSGPNELRYGMDTTGGNSGSPVINDLTGEVYGIHTHGGCTGSGNAGTWLGHASFQNAVANPTGVCFVPLASFAFPGGQPQFISPSGTTIDMTIDQGADAPVDPSTAMGHFNFGGGEQVIPLSHNGGNSYTFNLPAGDCFDSVEYYFTVETIDGQMTREPRGSTNFSGVVATGANIAADFNFESDPGWTVTDGAGLSTGSWERGVPAAGGSRGDPGADGDGSGQCWVTDNVSPNDVDGGTTTLTTSVFDLSSFGNAEVSYLRWNSSNGTEDVLEVEVSDDAGASWVLMETIGTNNEAWGLSTHTVSDFVALTSTVQFRFTARDIGGASISEAAIDGFSIKEFECSTSCPADVNGDGLASPADFTKWLACFNNPEIEPGCGGADVNGDGTLDPADFTAWLSAFNAGCN